MTRDELTRKILAVKRAKRLTWKELIQEEFGDGIMSAIDFDMELSRLPHEKGDRVKIVMSGKYLPYKTY